MNSRKTDYLRLKPYHLSFAPLKNLLMLLGLIASSTFAQAQGSAHQQLTLNGLAVHWALGREYYIGSLYLPETSSDPETILAMDGLKRMEFKVTNEKWSPRRFAQMWNQAILINNKPEDLNAVSDAIIAFTGLAKDNLIYGDHILIDYTPGEGSKISLNGSLMFATKHDSFFTLLLNTWVGRRPPSSDFKTAILTLQTDEETEDLLSRFDVIVPEKSRVAVVAGWSTATLLAAKKTKAAPPKQTAKTKKKANSKASASTGTAAVVTTTVVTTTASASAVTTSKTKTKVKVKTKPKPKPKPKPTSAPVQKTAKPSAETKKVVAKTESKAKKPAQKTTKKESPKVAATKKSTISEAEKEKARIRGLRNLYRANMLRLTYRHVTYPSRAIKLNQEGTVVLKVTVNRKGKVLNIDREEKSKYVSLNKAAEKAVKKATPYPAIPEQLSGDKFDFKIPIRFRIPK